MTKNELIETIAKICHYATEHTFEWDDDLNDFDKLFQCTSFTVACFLTQNTKLGDEGVECGVVLGALCERPVKSYEEWVKICTDLVDYYNGNETLYSIVANYADY